MFAHADFDGVALVIAQPYLERFACRMLFGIDSKFAAHSLSDEAKGAPEDGLDAFVFGVAGISISPTNSNCWCEGGARLCCKTEKAFFPVGSRKMTELGSA